MDVNFGARIHLGKNIANDQWGYHDVMEEFEIATEQVEALPDKKFKFDCETDPMLGDKYTLKKDSFLSKKHVLFPEHPDENPHEISDWMVGIITKETDPSNKLINRVKNWFNK